MARSAVSVATTSSPRVWRIVASSAFSRTMRRWSPTQVAIERDHLVHVWIAACRSGDLQHADDDMPNVAAVNIGVTAVQVAEGTREAVRDTLEEDVAVAIAVQLGERAGQTKLERGVSRP